MKKIAIVGSRKFKDLSMVHKFVSTLPQDTIIVSGGALGVDSAASQAAKKKGLMVKIFIPDWFAFGKAAGMMRNSLIVDYSDEVYAFHDGTSRGTADTIQKATIAGKLREVFTEL